MIDMTKVKVEKNKKYRVKKEAVELLLTRLKEQKFKTIGPTVRDETIILDELETINDLPIGITDVHEAGTYRLKKRKDKALFGYNVGPFSIKKYLFPPHLTLLKSKRIDGKITILSDNEPVEKLAFSVSNHASWKLCGYRTKYLSRVSMSTATIRNSVINYSLLRQIVRKPEKVVFVIPCSPVRKLTVDLTLPSPKLSIKRNTPLLL